MFKVEQFKIEHLPELLKPSVFSQLQRFSERLREQNLSESFGGLTPEVHRQTVTTFVASDYVADQLERNPALIMELAAEDLGREYPADYMAQRLTDLVLDCDNEAELAMVLRRFRSREMVRIIWRDVNGLASYQQTVAELSAMADACIGITLTKLYQLLEPRWGVPYYPETNEIMPLVVLGMGKLGAQELNLSSDVDLMFAYQSAGETRGGSKAMDHSAYFTRLGQKLIKLLDENTKDGFVFRVDMRLRPHGNSGALALSFQAMERYYEEHGREWERYAMIKARAIGADKGDGDRLLTALRPFVFRRYIDFGVVEALRGLKKLINQEVLRRGNEDNIKIGAGGIRDIEFIAQVFQLIRGGQDHELQVRNLLQAMEVIKNLQLLPANIVDELCANYIFLRNLEHRLQALQDRQTQTLPGDEISRWRLVNGLGFADWKTLYETIANCRNQVRVHFDNLIAPPEADNDESEQDLIVGLWLEAETTDEEARQELIKLGFADAGNCWQHLQALRASRAVEVMQAVPRERLDRLMPMIIRACSQQKPADESLIRVLDLVDSVLRRSAYIALLNENPKALERLAMLFAASSWVAESITRHPILLDELLNEATLFSPPDLATLKSELQQLILRIPEDDLEQQMEALRHFQNSHVLRVAASELAGTLPLMRVSDYLTWLAETVLQAVFDIAWRQLTSKYGVPSKEDGSLCNPDFLIVGYGKLGGIELSYSSDLDLVFIHDGAANGSTKGQASIENGVFFARLGQRIIHILTSKMASGSLYETDMRLRPSGNSGLLVSSLKSFAEYQQEKAWNWEHQALIRARVVAGDADLKQRFEAVRAAILSRSRDQAQLQQDVIEMRTKMLGYLSTYKESQLNEERLTEDHEFDIKHDPGGLVDIEFLAQYWVLNFSHDYPRLAKWTDNMRVLDEVSAAKLLPEDAVLILQQAYLSYRSELHTLALQNKKGKVSADRFVTERRNVRKVWHESMGD